DLSAEQVVELANDRCDQENVIEQLKNGVNALRVSLYDLISNWAYMVIAALAWNIKSWFALMMHRKTDRRDYIRMEFRRFLNTVILIPAMIIRRARGHHHPPDRLHPGHRATAQRLGNHRTNPLRLTAIRTTPPRRTPPRAITAAHQAKRDPARLPRPQSTALATPHRHRRPAQQQTRDPIRPDHLAGTPRPRPTRLYEA
ncbi:MAG: transposase, partial [Dermatophilaceae bacterium]